MDVNAKWEDLRTREQWVAWQAVAKVESPDALDWWTGSMGECCTGCIHADFGATWCNLMALPATRNPYTGQLGMACMGAGKATGQQDLFTGESK